MISRLRPAPVVAALAAATLICTALTGCGSDSADGAGNGGGTGANAGSSAGFPVSVPSALGTAVVKKRPQRVVTLGWGSDDAALALGVAPVGMAIDVPEAKGGISPWARAKLHGATPTTFSADGDAIPYEKIAALHPDVILAVYSGVTAKQYKTLSAIAPTVGYPRQPWATSWQDQLAIVGKALGRSAQAAKVRAQVQRGVAAARAAHPEFRGRTVAFGSGTKPGSYNFYLPGDPRLQLLGSLGFTVSDAATTTFHHGADSPSFATTVSLEQVSKLRADVLVAWYLSKQTQSSIEKEPVFRDLGPVRHKAYVPLTDPALLFATSAPNALTIPWMLHTYVPLLSTAAKAAA